MKHWAINQLNNGEAEMLLYGYIGSEVVNANDFKRELMALPAGTQLVKLRINSGGGSVFEGVTIFNAIRESAVPVHAYIDGICASMASVIVLACEKIYMSKMAMMMTHRPSGYAGGNADSLKSHAQMLEDVEAIMCEVYARRTGLAMEAVKERFMGQNDKWMNAEVCMSQKLIDGIYDAVKMPAPPSELLRNERDLVNHFTNYLTQTDMKQIMLSASALAALKITAEAADATAVEQAINNLAATAAKADGLQAELATAKTKVLELENAQVKTTAEALVDGAVAANKIPAGERDKYVKLAMADYATTKELVDAMKPYNSIESRFATNPQGQTRVQELLKMSGKELYMTGQLEELRKLDFESFKMKYEEYWGSPYKHSK